MVDCCVIVQLDIMEMPLEELPFTDNTLHLNCNIIKTIPAKIWMRKKLKRLYSPIYTFFSVLRVVLLSLSSPFIPAKRKIIIVVPDDLVTMVVVVVHSVPKSKE